jgi:hypothetical protein
MTLAHFVVETDIPAGVAMSFTALGHKIIATAKLDLIPGDECVVRLSDGEIITIKQGNEFIIYPAAKDHLTDDLLGIKWELVTNE